MPKNTSYHQSTVSKPISWEGIGLHSGVNSTVTVCPADIGFGIKFKRTDLLLDRFLMADIKYVSSTNRSTDLSHGEIVIGTIEHILAAMWGAGITNAEIEIDGPEIPILDGSAVPFYNKLRDNKIIQKGENAKEWTLEDVIEFEDEVSGASYTLIPHHELSLDIVLSYPKIDIGGPHAHYHESEDFLELADSRTFVLTSELEELCKRDLIKGGDIDNAILVSSGPDADKELIKALKMLKRSDGDRILQKFKEGYQLKYPNELARHKALDLIGDLSLLGHRLKAKIIARKPGHTGNAALVKHLKPLLQKFIKLHNKPHYDPDLPPVLDTLGVQGYLPHRYPFLMVDKIIKMTDTLVVGVKNVTFNEGLFQGHFPDNPVFPGVLQMEALAQAGGVLALCNVEDPSEWDTYFIKMDKVKFKKLVLPGDTMILKMELLSPIRRGIVHMQGTTYVGDNIVSEGELIAQLVKRKSE